jgi:hypothetical protein
MEDPLAVRRSGLVDKVEFREAYQLLCRLPMVVRFKLQLEYDLPYPRHLPTPLHTSTHAPYRKPVKTLK